MKRNIQNLKIKQIKKQAEELMRADKDMKKEIARHTKTESVLRLTHVQFKSLVEANIIGVVIGDIYGNIKEANDAFLNIVGYARSDVTSGKLKWTDLTPPEWRPKSQQAVEQLKKSGSAFPFEKEYICKDGSRTPVLVGVALLPGKKGECISYILDLTERKRREQATRRLEKMKLAIEKRRHIELLKDEFIGTVSHELRTPLAIAQGAIENLKNDLAEPLPAEQHNAIEIANRNIHRLGKMIDNLLDLSRLETGKTHIHPQRLRLRPLIQDMVEDLRAPAEQRHIAIKADLPASLPDVTADPKMITKVLRNLMDNALRNAQTEARILLQTFSEEVRISVIDDGPGIPANKTGNLFDKFVQVNRSMGGGYRGTGLGLAICKEIITLHQGRIWVESVVGRGTQLHFTLPRYIQGGLSTHKSSGGSYAADQRKKTRIVSSRNGAKTDYYRR